MSELQRAKIAYKQIYEKGNLPEDYTTRVKQMPMMIQTNGLAQTVTFYNTKKGAHARVLADIYEYLLEEKIINNNNGNDLVEVVVKADSNLYRILTSEIMAYLQWMKRLSEGKTGGD